MSDEARVELMEVEAPPEMSSKDRDLELEGLIQPVGENICFLRITKDDEMSEGGIIIPEQAREKSQEHEVVAVGTGTIDQNGNMIPISLRVGQRVILPRYCGTEIEIGKVAYQFAKEKDVLTIVHGKKALTVCAECSRAYVKKETVDNG